MGRGSLCVPLCVRTVCAGKTVLLSLPAISLGVYTYVRRSQEHTPHACLRGDVLCKDLHRFLRCDHRSFHCHVDTQSSNCERTVPDYVLLSRIIEYSPLLAGSKRDHREGPVRSIVQRSGQLNSQNRYWLPLGAGRAWARPKIVQIVHRLPQ